MLAVIKRHFNLTVVRSISPNAGQSLHLTTLGWVELHSRKWCALIV